MDESNEASRPLLSRYPSETLLMPRRERAKPIFYGVESFWPTLIDFYSVQDDTRVLWSSRSHRKTFYTLYMAFVRDPRWRFMSWSLWTAAFSIAGASFYLYGSVNECDFEPHAAQLNASEVPIEVIHKWVDLPYFLGAVCFFIAQLLTYLEVINCCHDLERWLHEYVHAKPSVRRMKWFGFSPYRIDYWSALLNVVGWGLLVCARGYIYRAKVFGVINLSRGDPKIFWGHWIPSLFGYFCLTVGMYLAHVEVIHRWFVCRLNKLEFWVTGTNCLSVLFLFMCSVSQFIDPVNIVFTDDSSMTAFQIGSALGLAAAVLSVIEVERLHLPSRHPVYGKFEKTGGSIYGSV
ncbi:hypothetical protein LEN26_005917 [Aphanomyces euteiches]|nr:hypothetical protein AeMF1_021647 [Aphanomyces euteiches]KAH9137095.1 hypothetical protein LEN26_005917 [Aphanomyces euteiches]KAH9196123.1 hypothetical protein AeNC1_001900 [Aphanomyces euteiches]